MGDMIASLFDEAIKQSPTGDLAAVRDAFLALHERVGAIRHQREIALGEKQQAERAWDAARARYDEAMARLQESCPHPLTRHHPDPSGGSDSFTTCEVCGKFW